MNGAFSPLTTFLGQADYENVCSQMRLADGTIWPMPVCLDLPEELANSVNGQSLALRDLEGVILAVLHVDEVYTPDREAEAQNVFGTTNTEHPGVAHLLQRTNPCYVSGRLEGLAAAAPLRLPDAAPARRPRSATSSRSWAGRRSWPSRPATPCTGPTRRSPCGRPRRAAPTCSSTRSSG